MEFKSFEMPSLPRITGASASAVGSRRVSELLGSAGNGIEELSAAVIHKSRKYIWQDKLEFYIHVVAYQLANLLEVIAYGPAVQKEVRLYVKISECYSFIEGSEGPLPSRKGYGQLKTEAQKHIDVRLKVGDIIQLAVVSSYIIHRVKINTDDEQFRIYVAADVTGNKPLQEEFISDFVPVIPGLPDMPKKSVIEIDRTEVGKAPSGSANGPPNLGAARSTSAAIVLTYKETIWDKLISLGRTLLIDSSGPSEADATVTDENDDKAKPALGLMAVLHLKKRLNNFRQSVNNRSPRAGKASQSKQLNEGFHKFKHDDELLSESLSFLHASDMMSMQTVCKKWHQVLEERIKQTDNLVISAQSLPQHQLQTTQNSNSITQRRTGPSYVTADTVCRLLNKKLDHVDSLELDKCVLNKESFTILCKSLAGKMKRLSIGLVKLTPDVFKMLSITDDDIPDDPTDTPVSTMKSLEFMNGPVLKMFLERCGYEINHLELSITIKDVPPDIFSRTPKLRALVPLHVNFTDRVMQERGNLNGTVDMEEYLKSFDNIQMPGLLQLMRDATHEALALTDTRGNIVVANEGFELLTGYNSIDIYGQPFEILFGKLTDENAGKVAKEVFKRQKKAAEVTAIFYTQTGQAFIAQAVLVPNIASHKGLLLNHKSLSMDFLLSLISDEAANGGALTVREWLATQKTLKYHMIRLGALSEAFKPNKLAQRAKMKI